MYLLSVARKRSIFRSVFLNLWPFNQSCHIVWQLSCHGQRWQYQSEQWSSSKSCICFCLSNYLIYYIQSLRWFPTLFKWEIWECFTMTMKVYGLTEVCCSFTILLFFTLPIDRVYLKLDLCYLLWCIQESLFCFQDLDDGWRTLMWETCSNQMLI